MSTDGKMPQSAVIISLCHSFSTPSLSERRNAASGINAYAAEFISINNLYWSTGSGQSIVGRYGIPRRNPLILPTDGITPVQSLPKNAAAAAAPVNSSSREAVCINIPSAEPSTKNTKNTRSDIPFSPFLP